MLLLVKLRIPGLKSICIAIRRNKLLRVLVEADEGKLSETQLFAALESVTGVKADIIKKDWFELGQLNTETLSFIKQHKEDYHFALLSNAIESYIKQYFDMFNLYGVFDEVYISSVIRLAKPNRAIFDYVLATFPHPLFACDYD